MAKKTPSRTFDSIGEIVCNLAEQIRPPERLTVSQSAEKYRYVNNPGSYIGPWKNSTAPYLTEIQDVFADPVYYGEVVVAPAQSGKTDALCLNPIVHAVTVAGFDLIVYSPTQTDSRDFSIRRVDRLNRHSPAVADRLLRNRDADNKFDKQYSNGVLLSLGHPSVSQLAGKPVPWVVLTDYDRMPEDVGGDGSPYDLASKRTTTFGSFAMAAAESSPSRPVTNLRWIRSSPHQAPPTTGILSLYNRGDRRQWYWQCPHEDCREHFVGNFKYMRWDQSQPSFAAMAGTAYMECPHCSGEITWDMRDGMQQNAVWLADGQVIDRNGQINGEPLHTGIASFWLNGVAAAFVTWPRLVVNYLNAANEYDQTGSEEALKKFYNTDLAEPYYPKAEESVRQPEVLKSREEPLTQQAVPENVRFMLATVDVQKNMFVVQVQGFQPGTKPDVVVIDRFDIRKSERLDEDGERYWVKPHAYPEDWDLLTSEVLQRSYPVDDTSGRRMKVRMTACDSGGKAGATANAYEYYRRLRTTGQSSRFVLLKGASTANAPRTRVDYPDSNRRDRFAGARGDVPVLFFNPNMLKDDLDGRLDVIDPGQGMIRFPDWLPEWFYAEMCAETRVDGLWKNPKNNRNEAWDLLYYALGLAYSPYIRADKIDWENPLSWYAPWERNSLVIEGEAEEHVSLAAEQPKKASLSLRELGEALA